MRRFLYGLGAAGALVVGLATMPAQHARPADGAGTATAMPYVGQAKVQAALAAMPAVPRPATIPGGGGNVRNLGPGSISVNGAVVLSGVTSYQAGITDAHTVRAVNRDGQRDLRMWRMESGRWIDKGCKLGSDQTAAMWSVGNGDFAAKTASCWLG